MRTYKQMCSGYMQRGNITTYKAPCSTGNAVGPDLYIYRANNTYMYLQEIREKKKREREKEREKPRGRGDKGGERGRERERGEREREGERGGKEGECERVGERREGV